MENKNIFSFKFLYESLFLIAFILLFGLVAQIGIDFYFSMYFPTLNPIGYYFSLVAIVISMAALIGFVIREYLICMKLILLKYENKLEKYDVFTDLYGRRTLILIGVVVCGLCSTFYLSGLDASMILGGTPPETYVFSETIYVILNQLVMPIPLILLIMVFINFLMIFFWCHKKN